MQKLFFFGDSISFGHMVSVHKTWCALISQKFEHRYICNNPSKNGNTTKDALNRITHDLENHRPDIVMVQFGLNDANFWKTDNGMPRITKNLYKANLNEIISRLKNISNTKKITISTNHLPTKTIDFLDENIYRSNVASYNNIVREVADENKILLIDHEKMWQTLPNTSSLLLDDGVHLSVAGHKFYYETILEANAL